MSIVPVYSVAKTYTAAAALLSFDPDDALGAHLAGLAPELSTLPLRSVLSHRSGLNDYGAWPDYREAVAAREDAWPHAAVLARAEVGEPGAFRYSNIGYLLIRLALEARHGGTFFEVLLDTVLGPLGVSAAPFATSADWDACDHPAIDDSLRAYDPQWVYTGTFAAEPHEAARGIAGIMRGELGAGVAKAMCEAVVVEGVPATHPMSPGASYGLGLMVRGAPATVVGHGGGGPGFSLFAAASRDGARWCGEVSATESEDLDLIRRCVDAVS